MLKKKKPQEILLNIFEFNEIRKRKKKYGEIVHIIFGTSNHVIIDFTSEIYTNLTTHIDLLDQKWLECKIMFITTEWCSISKWLHLSDRNCTKEIYPGDSRYYLENVETRIEIRPCPPGTIFLSETCGCTKSFPVLEHFGNSTSWFIFLLDNESLWPVP